VSRIALQGPGAANIGAFLDMIAVSEIGPELLSLTDDGYNVIVGSHGTIKRPGQQPIPPKLILFNTYVTHPRQYQRAQNSDAAGRYQLMGRYYEPYKKQLGLKDFCPESQDWIALQLIRECRAVDLIRKGDLEAAVHACLRHAPRRLHGSRRGVRMSPLALFAGPYAKLARLAVVALVALAFWGHGFWKGNEHGTQKLTDHLAAQAKADTKLAAARVQVVKEVEIKYRDRIKVERIAGETITREVKVYVTKEDDAGCSVPVGTIRVLNAAWAGEPPGPPAESDRGPSGNTLSSTAGIEAGNAATCRIWKQQRDGLIEFYQKQQATE